jgi:hypothetical protein
MEIDAVAVLREAGRGRELVAGRRIERGVSPTSTVPRPISISALWASQ